MPPAGILQTEMDEDAVIEIEIQQELERINLDEAGELDFDDNRHNVFQDDGADCDVGGSPNKQSAQTDEEVIPGEIEEYLQLIENQRLHFQQELEECDSLLNGNLKELQDPENSLVPYDDWKEIEEAARQQGLSVDEFKAKLLQEIENDPFELEELGVSEDEDFSQERLDRLGDKMSVEKRLTSASDEKAKDHCFPESCGPGKLLAIEGSVVAAQNDSDARNEEPRDGTGTIALVHSNILTDFSSFLREQMELVDERFNEREVRLKKQLEIRKLAEDQVLLAMEQQHAKILQDLEKEKQQLAFHRKEMEKTLEKEKEKKQKVLEQDLKQIEVEIAQITKQLNEDHCQLARMMKEEEEERFLRNNKAAVTVQRWYRGYRTRKQQKTNCQKLAEKREQRRIEVEKRQIEKIEKRIQEWKEEEKRKKEEERKKREDEERKKREDEERKKREDEERKKREDEERKQEEKRKEEERVQKEEKKRKKEEEERKRKEEEQQREAERRWEEERKHKEEEERRKKAEENERKKKEEEVEKRKMEEDKKKKEEVKRKKAEEEERKKEEEKKKQEEERKRKEEEKRLLEENRKKGEEECRQKEEEKRKEKDLECKQQEEEEQKSKEEENRLKEERKRTVKEGSRLKEGEEKMVETMLPGKETTETGAVIKTGERSHQKTMIQQTSTETQGVSKSTEDAMNTEAAGKGDCTNFSILTERIESNRLAWMKICLPWSKVSNEPWKLKSNAGRKKAPRRPSSAKKLPPLPESSILAAGQVGSIRQVTTVELCDLPGHCLSSLEACVSLKHLKLTRCGIISLDHLSSCRQLQCIDVQGNLIEFVELKELNSLHMLNLAHNKLTSVHGLESCPNIRWLNLGHNKLTHLGGLSSLRHLHTLCVSNNQLVTTAGLELCPSIQYLDLSANYLTAITGVEKLGILLELDAASNNISELPILQNQVLLQRLILRENSIGPSVNFCSLWLPLLTHLDLSQNIIEDFAGISYGLFALKKLDLAVNQIVDSSQLLPALSTCVGLEDLALQGNAVMDEDDMREKVKNKLPSLMCLNGETLRLVSGASTLIHEPSTFEIMCLQQICLHKELKQSVDSGSGTWTMSGDGRFHICDVYFNFCDKSFKMAVEHRYAHEYGELSSPSFLAAVETPRSSRSLSAKSRKMQQQEGEDCGAKESATSASLCSAKNRNSTAPAKQPQGKPVENPEMTGSEAAADFPQKPPVYLTAKEKFEMALQQESSLNASTADSSLETSLSCQSSSVSGGHGTQEQATLSHSTNSSSMKNPIVEDVNRVPSESKDNCTHVSTSEQHSNTQERYPATIKSGILDPKPLDSSKDVKSIGKCLDGVDRSPCEASKRARQLPSSNMTAAAIGALLLKESSSAFTLDRKPDDDDSDIENLEELMEGLQFDVDGFLDLEQFNLDEDLLDRGWRPEETPQIPSNYPVLAQIPAGGSAAKPPLPPVPHLHLTPSPGTPQAAPPSRPSQAWNNAASPVSDIQARPLPRPPSSVTSAEDSQAAPTGRSRREEKIAEEWGFKDSRTAELMLQRARKMKYNAERRKKISNLDPQQRLQLFRRLEEISHIQSVKPPPARVLPRKEYFQAREEEAQRREMEKQTEVQTKTGRTYEWLHTQVGDFDISSSRINLGTQAGEHQLMQTTSDSDLSSVQRPRYMQSPDSSELDSASNIGRFQPHYQASRHSISGDSASHTGQSTLLPPIKTTSAPSKNRERISWRTEPVNRSIGWGGGKKRGTNN